MVLEDRSDDFIGELRRSKVNIDGYLVILTLV